MQKFTINPVANKNICMLLSSALLGHGVLLQFLNSVEIPSPLQLRPLYFGSGLLQVRRHTSTPSPHETSHGILKVQLLYPPSTTDNYNKYDLH